MKFEDIAQLCFVLKKTSKKLLKVQLLIDFSKLISPKEAVELFDVLSGNFAREISKKDVGVSLQSTFQVLSSYYEVPLSSIKNSFFKHGDIFSTVQEFDVQKSTLKVTKPLMFKEFVETFLQISQISGKNSAQFKKNKLLFLFSKTNSTLERQILAAYIADILKIGTNEGILHDVFIHLFFPRINEFQFISNTLKRIVVNKDIEEEYSKLLIENSSLHIIKNIFEFNYLDETNSKKGIREIEYTELSSLVQSSFPFSNIVISNTSSKDEGRKIFNEIKSQFELVYSFYTSYVTTFQVLSESSKNFIRPIVIFNKPIQVMLGPRLYSFDEVKDKIQFPVFSDYKYDGLRLIIQNKFGDVKLFSRNLENLTSQFHEVVDFIKDNFSHLSCTLDAECVGFDAVTYQEVPFQELSKRIMTKSHNLKFKVIIGLRIFDILELEGKQIHLEPLEQRQEKMRELFINSQIKIHKSFSREFVKNKLEEYFN